MKCITHGLEVSIEVTVGQGYTGTNSASSIHWGQMAAFLWTIRTLASLFLGLAIAAAFLIWVACSVLVSDLKSEESQLVWLAELAETADHSSAADFRTEIQEFQDGVNDGLTQGCNFLLAVIIVGLAATGLVHLPDTTASLRWPGYTLMAAGVVALLLAWLAQAALPEAAGRLVHPQVSDEAKGAVAELLRGSFNPGLWAALIGTMLVIASHVHSARQRQKAKASAATACCR